MKIKITDEENENPVLHEQCDFRRELMKSLILARIEFQQKQFGKRQLQKNWQGLNLNFSKENEEIEIYLKGISNVVH